MNNTFFLTICGFLALSVPFFSWSSNKSMMNTGMASFFEQKESNLLPPSSTSSIEEQRCLSLDSEGSMDKLLSKHTRVFVVMPAKASGLTFNHFSQICMKHLGIPVAQKPIVDGLRKTITSSFQVPTIISSHNTQLGDLIKNTPKNALIMYVHREETDRLKSAIRHVMYKRNSSRVKEEDLLSVIERQDAEIHMSGNKLLTCRSYQLIEERAPNVVFVNFKQADKMLKLFAKRFCPQMSYKLNNPHNSTKYGAITVDLSLSTANPNSASLNDWLDAKIDLLEVAFRMKDKGVECQGTTRKMEHDLFSCPDETLHYSSSNFFYD